MNNAVSEIPRIYTAMAEWGACIVYISILRHRFKLKKMVIIFLVALILQSSFMVLTGDSPIVFWIPNMMIAILMMFFFIYSSCQISIRDAGYYCVRAFVLAELTASLGWQIYRFFWPEDDTRFWIKSFLIIIMYVLFFLIVWALEKRYLSDNWQININTWELTGAVFIGSVVFFISNISFVFGNTPFSSQYPHEILKIRTLVDAGGYAILYAHYIQCCQARARKELEALNNVLHNQYVQYKHSRESIDMINRKYHDLKHQISALRAENDNKKREEWLDSIENDIKDYEAQNQTGNSVLDTVLTSKSLYCQKHDIKLTCVVNGSLLDFMDVRDICSVFGNALDNAIEYEKMIVDKEKRLIHISVFQKQGFIILRFENYFESELDFEKGFPVTTKKDKRYHGYGLKSIRHIAEKYGGTAKVYTKDQWFELDLIFPIPESEN